MPVQGDIIEMRMRGYFSTVATAVMNVFQYEYDSPTALDLGDFGQEFIDGWRELLAAVLQPVLSVEVAYPFMDIVNLTNPLEIWSGAFTAPVNGAVTGDVLPPFATWSFLLKRTNSSTRNGAKRFSGIPESMQITGIPTSAAALLLNDLAGFLGDSLAVSVEDGTPAVVLLNPVIVRKDATGALIASQPVSSGQFRQIGTQNSRKFGRGI